MIRPHLKLETVKIKLLVINYRAGQIVIPEFQREYVWKKSKAPKLINSLYRGFPISCSGKVLKKRGRAARNRDRCARPA